jgi:hypothetical protein
VSGDGKGWLPRRRTFAARGKEPMKTRRADLESKMQKCLDRLGVPLKVMWIPKASSGKHGEIDSNRLLIYDKSEQEAWLTFEHEVYEYKFKEVTYAYRTLINSLIEAFEKLAYERKEKFLEFLPRISQVVGEEKA